MKVIQLYAFLPLSPQVQMKVSYDRTVFLPGNSEAMAYQVMSLLLCSVWMPSRILRVQSV